MRGWRSLILLSMSEKELTEKLLEEAIKIIMHEWGYTHDQVVDWLNRKLSGED